ncbi:MAG: amidase [Rhodospirillales bacterium]
MMSLRTAARQLAARETSSRALTEACLAAVERPDGEGARVFRRVDREAALSQADAMDRLRAAGAAPSPWAGLPLSIKDLFDLQGQVTAAGSRLLTTQEPARADAPAIARLRQAGFVFVGRTNMTEFAFSGLGLNPHYGTPKNPYARAESRIPGGSSSGAAVSVTDAMALAGIGSDTGGSCRIPAAFCGITGYKPTQSRVPLEGCVPLSYSLDSIGSLAPSVDCCAILDGLMASETAGPAAPRELTGLRLAVLTNYVLEQMEPAVVEAYQASLTCLSTAGATLSDLTLPDLEGLPGLNAKGGLAAAEALHWHRAHLERAEALYDPRVSSRIRRGSEQSAVDYLDLLEARRAMIAKTAAATRGFDGVIFPTVPIVAPRMSDLSSDADYLRVNLLALRNSTVANYLDRCAISLPLPVETAPVGLTIMGSHLGDRDLFAVARAVEAALAAS